MEFLRYAVQIEKYLFVLVLQVIMIHISSGIFCWCLEESFDKVGIELSCKQTFDQQQGSVME